MRDEENRRALDAVQFILDRQPPLEYDEPTAFLHAQWHPVIELFKKEALTAYTPFRSCYLSLEKKRFNVQTSINGSYRTVLVLLGNSKEENLYLMAKGFEVAAIGATLLVAASNSVGASRFEKLFSQMFSETSSESKYHSRVFWGTKISKNFPEMEEWLQKAEPFKITGTELLSQAGLFSATAIDQGSSLLAKTLPDTLHGHGADFGSGVGYLTSEVLRKSNGITAVDLFEVDLRAVILAKHNLQRYEERVSVSYNWCDLVLEKPSTNRYDWIVMNPPFHSGATQDLDLGKHFIRTAHEALKSGGELWMVANRHLKYEESLREIFKEVSIANKNNGFIAYLCCK